MRYFVTGASGFIGKRLVRQLLQRRGSEIHFLIRESSRAKLDALLAFWGKGARRVHPVIGDLALPKLGLSPAAIRGLGRIDHFVHLAALYDLTADPAAQLRANAEGTRHAVQLANALKAGCFQHVSSIAAAGLYEGVFREDMFAEAEHLEHPYFSTKHEAERIVRTECAGAWRIYRPGIVVGDSTTGEMDKVDGLYYFFKPIQRLRRMLPAWVPLVGIEGGRINVVPVDFVVRAIDHLAHAKGLDGQALHIVDPEPYRVGDILNLVARAAHAPQFTLRFNAAWLGLVPAVLRNALLLLPPVRRAYEALLDDLGVPADVLQFINYPTRFDCRTASARLGAAGIECPRLEDYADRLWDYWERHLDPALHVDRSLPGRIAGQVVLITGGSSGIGLAAAIKVAQAGATTIIVGRDAARLDAARATIEAACAPDVPHGEVLVHAADLSRTEDADRLVAWVIAEFGGVDVLVNNAGRSIRRSIEASYDRFHDYERTMQINYFGALRVTTGLLPRMVARRRGHVINISSIGVLTNAPRFAAYVASKAALDAWTRCAASEFLDCGVSFTTINMPLVRTPMIAPTKLYDSVPTLSPAQAADMVVEAIVDRPVRVATRLGTFGQLVHALAPRLAQVIMNTAFRMFPDSTGTRSAASGDEPRPTADQLAVANMMRGIHF